MISQNHNNLTVNKNDVNNPDAILQKIKDQIKSTVKLDVSYNEHVNAMIDITRKQNNKKLTKKQKEELNRENQKRYNLAIKALSLDTKAHMVNVIDERYVGFALQMTEELEEEFDVKTASEKALIQSAVIAYCRMLKLTTAFNANMFPEWVCHERAHFLSIFGKELDKANRTFLSAIQILKQMNTPPIKMNIKTNNAFIAQNQQLNAKNSDS